jgi:dihydroorotate dehydrogenase
VARRPERNQSKENGVNIYIAPPFGTYFRPTGALSVRGSFTLKPRPGRTGQVLRTVRRVRGAWVNSIGLRNPGIESLRYDPSAVYSLAGIDDGDWEKIHDHLYVNRWPSYNLELNLSCPNVVEYGHPSLNVLKLYTDMPSSVISVKLPPDKDQALSLTELALCAGIKLIHLSNTLPSPLGGISGWPLLEKNLSIVEAVARCFHSAKIIAGGGITDMDAARRYHSRGASHFSLGSVFFNPIRGLQLYNELNEWANR